MTGFNSNINDVIARFQKMKQAIDVSDALIAGVNAARGEMTFRIFNQGLDAYEKPLGKYKGRKSRRFNFRSEKSKNFLSPGQSLFSEYELLRLKNGRQIQYKDLEFTGDLRRGIKVVKNGSGVYCVIVNQKLILISQGQEEQLNTDIFKLSESEREAYISNTNELIKQIYVRNFNAA